MTLTAADIAALPAEVRAEWMATLTDAELYVLKWDWTFWRRDKQTPPSGDDWFTWMLLSGRGFGKTWTGSNYVIDFARNNPGIPIALIGQSKADVRDTMIEVGESSILGQSPPDFMPKYEPSKRRLTWPNGTVAMVYSGDEPDQLRGPQHGLAWLDELAKFKSAQDTWDNVEMGLRLGEHPRIIVTTTPRPTPLIMNLAKDPRTHMTVGATYENRANLPPSFLARLMSRYEGTRLGRQEIYGDILSDVPGALWNYEMLEDTRVSTRPVGQMQRVGIAIDPAVTATDRADETGIIIGGRGQDGHVYIWRDLSGRYSPNEWGSKAVAMYNRHRADFIVAEVNNGGDLVKHVIHSIDSFVNFKSVRATRGKYVRAEPIAALYEQGKVHHVGLMSDLEDQMCTWVPGEASPDRLDALVWLVTYLAIGSREPRKAQAKRAI